MGNSLQNIQYSDFQDAFLVSGVALAPAEFHGLMTGFMCMNPESTERERERVYSDWLSGVINTSTDKELVDRLERLFKATLVELEEFSDFQFRILMPDDEASVDDRSQALKSFCAGFLGGLGSSHFCDEIAEVLADLERIASLREEVGESEENESDLFELVEFVRVSVLFIFSENGRER